MNPMTMTDRVVLITGAARGQGAAEAELLSSLGATVVACDVLDDDGEAAAQRLGPSVVYRRLDVTEAPAWAALVADVGRIDVLFNNDVLVNNAGVYRKAPLTDWSADEIRYVLDVNLVGPILGMQAVSQAMPSGSSIVNVASTAALRCLAGALPYSSSGWGLRGASRSAALELAPLGIRVNCVCPGAVDTPMIDVDHLDFAHLPVPHAAQPEEIAQMVAFLASDAGSYCTGAEFIVDAGATA